MSTKQERKRERFDSSKRAARTTSRLAYNSYQPSTLSQIIITTRRRDNIREDLRTTPDCKGRVVDELTLAFQQPVARLGDIQQSIPNDQGGVDTMALEANRRQCIDMIRSRARLIQTKVSVCVTSLSSVNIERECS